MNDLEGDSPGPRDDDLLRHNPDIAPFILRPLVRVSELLGPAWVVNIEISDGVLEGSLFPLVFNGGIELRCEWSADLSGVLDLGLD